MMMIDFSTHDETRKLCAGMVPPAQAHPSRAAFPGPEAEAEPGGPAAYAGIAMIAPSAANAHAVGNALTKALCSSRDVIADRPPERPWGDAVRCWFGTVVVMGGGGPVAARALRTARYDAVSPGGSARTPTWFLARSDRPPLAAKVRLASGRGPSLPSATRTLPTTFPRLSPDECRKPLAEKSDEAILSAALPLAAPTLAVAADPAATRLDAARLAAPMNAPGTPAEVTPAERLAGSAEAYDRAVTEDRDAPVRSGPRRLDRRVPAPLQDNPDCVARSARRGMAHGT